MPKPQDKSIKKHVEHKKINIMQSPVKPPRNSEIQTSQRVEDATEQLSSLKEDKKKNLSFEVGASGGTPAFTGKINQIEEKEESIVKQVKKKEDNPFGRGKPDNDSNEEIEDNESSEEGDLEPTTGWEVVNLREKRLKK